ncbi:MAG: DUF4832 domain-containing protein [Pseudonocardia sp.]
MTFRSGRPRALAALVLVAAALAASCSRTESALPTSPDGGVRFAPEVIAPDAPELANPLRGQYQWIGNGPDPADWPAPDVYYRDAITWGEQVERTRGAYDFAVFERGLAEAGAGKGMFGFRVMAFCPGCGETLAPDYVARQPDGQPDWNSESFLAGYADLMKALGARYDGDPRLGFVDVGGYGSFGEYHLFSDDAGPVGTPITPENSRRLVQSVLDAFPTTFVLMMTPNADLLRDALALSERVGIRVDCVGNDGLKGSKIDDVPEARERWRTAPWVGEWCGGSDVDNQYRLGLEQVRDYHITSLSSANFPGSYADMSPAEQEAFRAANKAAGYRFVLNSLTVPAQLTPGSTVAVSADWSNVGVGPGYLPWDTMIELRGPGGEVAFAARSAVDLATLQPTGDAPVVVSDQIAVPADLPPGRYDVHVRVVSPEGYLDPLRLAIAGRTADGSYPLGPVEVTAP